MIITLDKTYYARVDSPLLGYMGETESRTITVQGYQTEGADRYILRLSYADGAQFDVDVTSGTYNVQASLLRAVGNVKCQLLAVKSTSADTYEYVKKSNVFTVTIKPSVGGDTPVPTYEETVAVLDKVLAAEIAADECIAARDTAVTAAGTATEKAAVAVDKATEAAKSAEISAENASQTSADRAGVETAKADVLSARDTAVSAADTATEKAQTAIDNAATASTAATTATEKATEIAESAEQITVNANNITELKSDLTGLNDSVFGEVIYEKGYSVLANDGYIEEKIGYYQSKNGLFFSTAGSGYGDNWKTRIFPVMENTTYKWYAKNLIKNSACVWLDSEQKTIEKFDVTSSTQYATVQTSVSPAGAVYFAIGASTKDATTEFMDLQYAENVYNDNGINGTVVNLEERVSIIEENIVIPDKTNPLSVIKETPGLLSCFLTVGCIGDSLASGEAVSNNGAVGYHDIYKHSWGQYLARRTGNTYYNWSQGGARTDTWLNSSFATKCYSGEYPCDAYIIGLGENDYTKCKNDGVSFAEFIGTVSDIDSDNHENNANTFIGRYAKIIQKIFEVQPKAKIFVICDPIAKFETAGFNQAIRDIANFFDNVYLMDLYTYGKDLYAEMRLESQIWRGGHGSAYFYYKASLIMATYIDWIMENNPSEFNQIEFIGTDWEWN